MSTPVSVLRRPLNRRGSPQYGDKANIVKAPHSGDAANDPPTTLSKRTCPVNLFTT